MLKEFVENVFKIFINDIIYVYYIIPGRELVLLDIAGITSTYWALLTVVQPKY